MLISVIVPVYNSVAWIERCSHALLEQRVDGDYEVLLVDNNSTDGSKNLIPQHPRIRVLEEKVQGPYAARNFAARHSRGDILAFTDADCVPSPDWLNNIARALENSKTQIVLGSREASVSGTVALVAAYDDARVKYIVEGRRSRSYFGFTNNMAVRRQTFERYGPFPAVARGGDTLFLRRVSEADGAESVVFQAGMRVRHLELESAWTYIRKNFLYARVRANMHDSAHGERLGLAECLGLFRGVIRGRPPVEQISLALTLGAGRLSWMAGSIL